MCSSSLPKLNQRTLKFTGSVGSLVQSVANGDPLYVHAKNWLAELAAVVPLSNMVMDSHDTSIFFPEQGLHLSLPAVERVHGVMLDHHALALEFAMRGSPQCLSVVAVPNISEMEHFRSCFRENPATMLREDEYRKWRDGFVVCPTVCPCCEEAAKVRRATAERNPLVKIFQHLITNSLTARCAIISPAMGFTTWLRPQQLEISKGVLSIVSTDGQSMLEVDSGIVHALRISCSLVDDEPFTELILYDSLGEAHLSLSAGGWDKEAIWRGFCG